MLFPGILPNVTELKSPGYDETQKQIMKKKKTWRYRKSYTTKRRENNKKEGEGSTNVLNLSLLPYNSELRHNSSRKRFYSKKKKHLLKIHVPLHEYGVLYILMHKPSN